MAFYIISNVLALIYGVSYFGYCCKQKKNSAALATAMLSVLLVAELTLLCVIRIV